MISINQHEKNEWSRLATWAFANGMPRLGARFEAASSLPVGYEVLVNWYDERQEIYRMWLVFGLNTEHDIDLTVSA